MRRAYCSHCRDRGERRGREVPMSNYVAEALVGEPEVLEDVAAHPAWLCLKAAATALHGMQAQDGSVPEASAHTTAQAQVTVITAAIRGTRAAVPARRRLPRGRRGRLRPLGRRRLRRARLLRLADRLPAAAAPRSTGCATSCVFPMYTQNGSSNRLVEAVLIEVIWPKFIAELEAGLHEQAVRAHPVPRLHPRLRHQLGGAVPGDGRDARDPDLHLGGDLRRPRGGPVPPGRARGRRDHPARTARRRGRACSTTSTSPRKPS